MLQSRAKQKKKKKKKTEKNKLTVPPAEQGLRNASLSCCFTTKTPNTELV